MHGLDVAEALSDTLDGDADASVPRHAKASLTPPIPSHEPPSCAWTSSDETATWQRLVPHGGWLRLVPVTAHRDRPIARSATAVEPLPTQPSTPRLTPAYEATR